MNQKKKVLTPGTIGERGVPSFAVMGEGPLTGRLVALYLGDYYRWMKEEEGR